MPKPSKENELIAKSEQFKTIKEKKDKILKWLHSEVTKVIEKNNINEQKIKIKQLETIAKNKIEKFDPIFAQQTFF